MRPPGDLDELGAAGRASWSTLVEREVETVLADLKEKGRAPERRVAGDGAGVGVRTIEWPAFPILVADELGAVDALELLDRPSGGGARVGRARQEEYAEWRLIHRDGEPRGFELTTEFREYWTMLAGHEPEHALDLLGEFSSSESPPPADSIFGSELVDPLFPAAETKDREEAFAKTMLPTYGDNGALSDFSAYNDGRDAICCMVQKSNSLNALLALALSAARTFLVKDGVTGETRYPSGSEAIAGLRAAAVDGRNSDPLIVERIVRFAGEGRAIGFDDPLGVYVRQMQLHELAQPDGEDVPTAWLELSRGTLAAAAADERSRAQRLRFELPADADFSLNELVVRRTGEELRFGGQLAELVELCAYVRAGAPGADLPMRDQASEGGGR